MTQTLRPFFPEVIYHSAVRRVQSRWRMLWFCLAAYVKYVGILLLRRPRVAQVVIASPADQVRMLPYIFLARLLGMRVVLAFHYDVASAYRRLPAPLRWLVRRGYAAAQRRCYPTKILQREFETVLAPLSAMVIPNPLSSQFADVAPLPYEERDNCVVFLGRFLREKGLFDLLNAAKRSAELNRPVQYHFWGDGDRPRNLPPNCVFHGWIDGRAKVEVLAKARLLALPSHSEAFGLAALEAMACGTPVVATRVGGLAEVVQDGSQGRLVACGNTAELLAAIESLLEDRRLWEDCSRRGRETVSRYAAADIAACWRGLYRGL